MSLPKPLSPSMAWILTCMFLSAISATAAVFPAQCLALAPLEQIHVLSRVSVSQKHVCLLDLVDRATVPEDWQKAMAQVDIGESPPGGSQKFIDPRNLRPFLCQFIDSNGTASSRVELHLPEMIVVERKTAEITQERIEEIFRGFITENAPWNPEDIVIQRITHSGLPSIPMGEVKHEVVPSPREKYIGNVAVTVNFHVDGEKARSLRVSGKVDVFQNVVQLNRPVKQNETIAESDLETQRISISDAPERYVTKADQAVNKRLTRSLAPHQPLQQKDLDKALVIKKGAMVTIVYDQPGLKLTAKGQVRDEGSTGDTVRIHNVSSNKTVSCRVLDSNTVQAAQ